MQLLFNGEYIGTGVDVILINFKEYDFCKIGARIQLERNEFDYSLQNLADKINVTRQTISKWEKGEGNPGLYDFLRLCNAFDCELGYLLCEEEYGSKTREVTNIQEKTGLPADIIANLQEIMQEPLPLKEAIYDFLNDLIDSFWLSPLAISYKKCKCGSYSDETYCITDNAGGFVDVLDGDISTIVLQNAFNRFIFDTENEEENNPLSRKSKRKYWKRLTEEERADIIAESIDDRLRGK